MLGPRDRLPEIGGLVAADLVEVDQVGVALRLPADEAAAVAREIDGERQAAGEAAARDLALDQAALGVQALERALRIAGIAPLEADLVEPAAGADHDAEGARRDLGIERTPVAGLHPVELVRLVGDEPGEDVEPPGGALWVGVRRDVGRERERLHQGDDVDAAALQHGAWAEVDLVHAEARDLRAHALAPRQEARAHAIGHGPQPEIEARGLDLRAATGSSAETPPPAINAAIAVLERTPARSAIAHALRRLRRASR